ncbi:MAG: radical SAM protein [Betaproteobacteria bacterium]|nr:radical SAM protein [Betaproteobacteria bacterium]MDE2422751.1 radical SAM protein [Betaproteobacteria bacterium]
MTQSEKHLTFEDHNRDVTGMTYVYPVVSRRSEGVSIGINLNTNNACNWACVYCQVPNLERGKAPLTDLSLLRKELFTMLDQVVNGDFMERFVDPSLRRLNDIAFSGNGEPTSAKLFPEAVAIVQEALTFYGLTDQVKIVVITNGSFSHQSKVQRAFQSMAKHGQAEIWFKCDRGTQQDILRINKVNLEPQLILERLTHVAPLCPTWIQTCMVSWDGVAPQEEELSHWLAILEQAVARSIPIKGVLLYSLARPSYQPEAFRLGRLSEEWLNQLAERVKALGLPVKVTP